MNKEGEQLLNKCDNCKLKECIGCEFTWADIQKIRKYIQELEQKESILDKVTEFVKNYINDKQNEYEAIFESYVCQTDEDEHIKEKELATIKGQKQVLRNILNIIEGEKK